MKQYPTAANTTSQTKKCLQTQSFVSDLCLDRLYLLGKPGVTVKLVALKVRAIANTVHNDDPRIVQQRFLSRVSH